MPTSPGPSTSNNWGWADIYLKRVFTLVELGPLQKWAAKPIGNKSDNTLKRVSDNTLKKGEWQHTQENVSTTAQKNVFKKIMKDQVGRIERSKIELEQRFC
jgi:hypothetical protein